MRKLAKGYRFIYRKSGSEAWNSGLWCSSLPKLYIVIPRFCVLFSLGWVEGGDNAKESGSFPSVPSSARTYQDLFKPAPTCRHQYQYFHQHPLQRQQWQTCICRRPAASCSPLPASRGASTLPPARAEAAVKEGPATARGGPERRESHPGRGACRAEPAPAAWSRSTAAPQ